MSERCKDCGHDKRTWSHINRCFPIAAPPIVQCVVPKCMVKTRTPTALGMCPENLWDEAHDAYYASTQSIHVTPVDASPVREGGRYVGLHSAKKARAS